MRAAVDKEPLIGFEPPFIGQLQREDRDHKVQRLGHRQHPVQRHGDPRNEQQFANGKA